MIYAASRLIDIPEFRRIARFRQSELVLALATTAGVLVVDILYGVLIAVALSMLDLFRRVARPHDAILGYAPGVPASTTSTTTRMPDRARPDDLPVRRAAVLRQRRGLQPPRLAAIDIAGADTEWFILNAEANVELDVTAADALESSGRSSAGVASSSAWPGSSRICARSSSGRTDRADR